MADGISPAPPIADVTIRHTVPADVIGAVTIPAHEFDDHCIAVTVRPTPAGPWTVWMSDDDRVDNFGGAGVAAAVGAAAGDAGYWVDPAHGTVGACHHNNSCADQWHGGCNCGAEAALTSEIRNVLLAAGRHLVREHQRRRTGRETAEERRRTGYLEQKDADWAGRILVGGSDAGWRLWAGNPPRNTGTIILSAGPIPEELDPQFCGIADDAIGLYAIRDPGPQ